MEPIAFFDIETSNDGKKIFETGAVTTDGRRFRDTSASALINFLQAYQYIAGHNIVAHDLPILKKSARGATGPFRVIDTLLLSPLLFPDKPYHNLLKDDKLETSDLNNPVIDSEKAKQLFEDEYAAFKKLHIVLQRIYATLLSNIEGFEGFFDLMQVSKIESRSELVKQVYQIAADRICREASASDLIDESPAAFAYALSLLLATDGSLTPPWVLKNYPRVQSIVRQLANTPCTVTCTYCAKAFDPHIALDRYFHFKEFRKYEGQKLQEDAIQAALNHKSLLAIFPTGGGKSIAFQLPALMAGDCARELTVVISPLQSLMKDQVDNLRNKGILRAVYINGLLDPVERMEAIESVADGTATLLYISPESLRSNTIRRLLLKRKISRFVIDEAHCFSSWGQDFRVDYLYIGRFIRELRIEKQLEFAIPVSCFTATAKQRVVEDICGYFKTELDQALEIFRSTARRTNLSYKVFEHNDEDDKYARLRSIVEEHKCPTIIYVSRTRRAEEISSRLSADGFPANHFHGKMEVRDKMFNQDQFVSGGVNIMVATSAFGMGVDKDNVGLVVHYEISDSLENYVQEAGRAGRKESLQARCYVLFSESDLDSHFNLLQQSKITKQEINQIWRAIKNITTVRLHASSSALDIARKAGWDENINQLETRVTTAIAALEMAGYLMRGQNTPSVYATSIQEKTADAAIRKIESSSKIDTADKTVAVRIIKKLFSSKSKISSLDEEAEARVDYIADQLGIKLERVIRIITVLRDMGILADEMDLSAFVKRTETNSRMTAIVEKFAKIENALIELLQEYRHTYNLKEITAAIEAQNVLCSVINIKEVIHFWGLRHLVDFRYEDGSRHHITIQPRSELANLKSTAENRQHISAAIARYLVDASKKMNDTASEDVLVQFSILDLKNAVNQSSGLFKVTVEDRNIEDALFYLSRIDALKIEGGFLVTYNRLQIKRLKDKAD
ncbi:MAG: RecQ family ATP-dependent DNA helicase, partial [Chitinophagaceae bacterium]